MSSESALEKHKRVQHSEAGHSVSSETEVTAAMQPFCQNPQLSRSLESELESAAKSGELKLQGKNLKDFPRLATDRYKLQDTTLAGLIRPNHCLQLVNHN